MHKQPKSSTRCSSKASLFRTRMVTSVFHLHPRRDLRDLEIPSTKNRNQLYSNGLWILKTSLGREISSKMEVRDSFRRNFRLLMTPVHLGKKSLRHWNNSKGPWMSRNTYKMRQVTSKIGLPMVLLRAQIKVAWRQTHLIHLKHRFLSNSRPKTSSKRNFGLVMPTMRWPHQDQKARLDWDPSFRTGLQKDFSSHHSWTGVALQRTICWNRLKFVEILDGK